MVSDQYRAAGERAREAYGRDGTFPEDLRRIRRNLEKKPVSVVWPLLARRRWGERARVGQVISGRALRWRDQTHGGAWLGAWYGAAGEQELREYLGEDFDETLLIRHREAVEKELEEASDETTFYRTCFSYLYDLARFASWGTKEPYLAAIRRLLPTSARLLDYGCGIGSDGLRFIEDGYRVDFADFANPSTRYLRWRLDRRNDSISRIHDVEHPVPGGYDLVFSFDVIEHVDDPVAFLDRIEALGHLVAVNFLQRDATDPHLHRSLPLYRLLVRAARRGIIFYHCYEGRSHFVIYGSKRPAQSAKPLAAGLLSLGLQETAVSLRRMRF